MRHFPRSPRSHPLPANIISEDDYNSVKQRELIDGIISSFRFKQLDVKKTGKLMDPDNIAISKKTQNISNDQYSMDIPSNWDEIGDEVDGYGDSTACFFINSDNWNYSLSDYTQSYDENFKVGENFKTISKTVTQGEFGSCYNYVYTYESDGKEVRLESHIFKKGNNIYSVSFVLDNLYYGSKYTEILNNIWKSFKLK
jgi:hypothetical protein